MSKIMVRVVYNYDLSMSIYQKGLALGANKTRTTGHIIVQAEDTRLTLQRKHS